MNENPTEFLEQWLTAGGTLIGQVSLRRELKGWSLRHCEDRPAESDGSVPGMLEIFTKPENARGIALKDETGNYRPLKTAPNLKRGWELRLPDVPAVRLALDFLYPAAVGNWCAWRRREVPLQTLRDTLNRQTGMYRVTGLARDDEMQAAVAETCDLKTKCLRKIVWSLDEGQPVTGLPPEKFTVPDRVTGALPGMPVLCTDACPLLIGAIRETVSRRRREEREAAAAVSSSPASGDAPPVTFSHSHA